MSQCVRKISDKIVSGYPVCDAALHPIVDNLLTPPIIKDTFDSFEEGRGIGHILK